MVNKNTEYEKFVQVIYQHLLRAQDLETIKVEHDVNVTGISGQEHQVDVYWEYKIGGIVHRVAIECKNYKSAITVGRVRDFQGVLIDVPHLQGAMVTRVGYQSGAVTYAKAYGIGLRIIRQVEKSDWEGRIRAIDMQINAVTANIVGIEIRIDQQWVEKEIPGASTQSINEILNENVHSKIFLNDRPTGQTLGNKINELFNKIGVMSIKDDKIHQQSFDLSGYLLEIQGKPMLRLAAIIFDFQRQESLFADILSESAAKNIVKDAISGNLQFIDEDGTITGDLDE